MDNCELLKEKMMECMRKKDGSIGCEELIKVWKSKCEPGFIEAR
jgi:hypothetical protein